MKMYSLVLFFVCLNLATMIITTTEAFPNPVVASTSDTQMTGLFNLSNFWIAGLGGAASIVTGALLANVFLGAFAGLVWVFGCLIGAVNWVFTAFPNLVGSIIKVMCQNAGIVGLQVDVISGLFSSIFAVLFSVVFFMFIMELFSQRYIT